MYCFFYYTSKKEWSDNSISWNPSNYKNISKLHLLNYELWQPELVLHKYNIYKYYKYLNLRNPNYVIVHLSCWRQWFSKIIFKKLLFTVLNEFTFKITDFLTVSKTLKP